ncbi:NAD-binding protein [Phormidesmis sp. 146-35]
MQGSLRRIFTGALFFAITFALAVIGYVMAGWSVLDSVYMVVITTFGVGYGEVRPIDTPDKKILTILVIVAGTSSAVYMVGGFVQMITEGEINKALGARKMTRAIETLEQHVIICGFGRMGQILARKIADANLPFVVIDNNPERIAKAETLNYLVRLGSATDEAILYAAGIDRAKVLATVLPDDAVNVFITLIGATIGDIEFRGKGTFIIVALRQADGTTINHPNQSLTLAEGDAVIVMGHRGDIPKFVRRHVVKRPGRYRGATF